MAIKKKPVKAVKKVQPKKAAKPVAKKVTAKKVALAKPVKKDSPKKHTPVVKKSAASANKSVHSKSTVPAKKTTAPAAAVKKPAPVNSSAKKPVIQAHPSKSAHPAPVAHAAKSAHPAPAVHAAKSAHSAPVAHNAKSAHPAAVAHPPVAAKPVQPVVVKAGSKTEDKKPVFKQQVKNTSPVTVKPEVKKPIPPPVKAVKVVMPEIKTKTVRKYEPEFTKSVLDIHQQEQTGPTMRYSDVELSEFRDLITKKLDSAKKELAYLQGLITRRDEMGGDETDNRYMTMEDGSMSMEREQLSQMASRQITFIDHLEKAMMRIENKTYGICRVTGRLIDKARLKAVPHATLSIEAKQTMNK
jgi:RNA polymerase-binding transcription factor DksA